MKKMSTINETTALFGSNSIPEGKIKKGNKSRGVRGRYIGLLICMLIGLFPMAQGQTFTQGNLAALLINGTGSNNGASIIELLPGTVNQASVINTFAIPSTVGANAMRFGVAATTGSAANSDDGTLFIVASANSTTTSGNYNLLTSRGAGAINKAYGFSSPNLAATYTAVSGNQARCATTMDNVHYFISDQGGLYTNGSSAATYSANTKSIKSFGGIVYISGAAFAISTVAAPNSTTITALPGIPVLANIFDFYMLSSGNNGVGVYDIMYVLSATTATAGTINKYSLVSGTWVANGAAYNETFGGFALSAQLNGGSSAFLYATTGNATPANSVVRLTDASGYNAALNITSTITLFTCTGAQVIKGIGFAPVTPSLALSAAQPAAGNASLGSADNIIGGIQLTETNTYTTLAGVTVTTAGTYVSGDITNLKLWLSASPTTIVGATQLGATQAVVGSGGTLSVSSLSAKINVGTNYILATASVAPNCVGDRRHGDGR